MFFWSFFANSLDKSNNDCTQNFDVEMRSKSYQVSVEPHDLICIYSGYARTIYSIGQAPAGSEVRYSMLHEEKQNYTQFAPISCENSFFFGITGSSTAQIYSPGSGIITFSVVALGETFCQTKVFVTNKIGVFNEKFTYDPQDMKCYFFASYGQQEIRFSSTLSGNDLMFYQCGSVSSTRPSSALGYNQIACSSPGDPSFVSINTTNSVFDRKSTFSAEITSLNTPVCPLSVSRVMTPTPEPKDDSNYIGPGAIVGIVLGSIVLLAIFVVVIVVVYRKRRLKVEAMTDHKIGLDLQNDESKKQPSGRNMMDHPYSK